MSRSYHLSLKSKEDIEKQRLIDLARLAALRKVAAKEAKAAMRAARAAVISELEGKVAEMMGNEHTARGKLMAKQAELKRLEMLYAAAKAGVEAVAEEADVAEQQAAALQEKLAKLLDEAAADEEDNALSSVE